MNEARLQIGALARKTATSVETIRYYERIGLLAPPARTRGNYRLYDRTHLERLGFIRRARGLGFPLGAVRTLLLLSDQRDAPCAEADRIARAHLDAVERKLADLAALRDALRATIGPCPCETVAECRTIAALSPG
ncbi:MAG: helix-turn-helix domain-containing protein [Rhodospirillales bacterium]|jgi:DNA-binding transcriptional MerR regulator|nr:helix-turn-helix domain-containing protein [Rhodospirillales bacterium]